MPNIGDHFITTLKQAHLEWGSHRHTNSRGVIYGEGYLQIPSDVSYSLEITNSKSDARSAEYDFSTSDGYIEDGKLLASGNQNHEKFAKQFQGLGNLKLLGDWFNYIEAVEGDRIQIDFISPTKILLTKI
ncbi:hypothetical protein ACR79S_01925 [Sphingobacterium spiritivorum]|uniref:hypothetical protein n=1 Tax=Sphingobacterium spiritivorum TaxID=258 RepID=UPI003DA405EA